MKNASLVHRTFEPLQAFSFLQDNGGLFGSGDSSDQSIPSGGGGSDIISALENIGVNFAAGAATVGVGALSNSLGVSPGQFAGTGAALGYNTSILARKPGSTSPLGAAFGVSPNTLLLGGVLLVGLVVWAVVRKG